MTVYLCYKLCMIPVKHFVERLASRTHHIWPRIHAFDHVTDTVTDLRHASNTDLEWSWMNKAFFLLKFTEKCCIIDNPLIVNYSQISLNGHLYKTNAWCWSLPFFSHFRVTILILSIRRTPLSDGQPETVNGHLRSALYSYKYLKMEMSVLWMTISCKIFNFWSSFSSSHSVRCYAFRPRSRERLLVISVWLLNEKMIPLFCFGVPVLAVLHKLNRRVFNANGFSLSFYWCHVTLTLCRPDTSLRRTVRAGPGEWCPSWRELTVFNSPLPKL